MNVSERRKISASIRKRPANKPRGKPFLLLKAKRKKSPKTDADDERSVITQAFLKTHRPQAAARPTPSLPNITMRVVDW